MSPCDKVLLSPEAMRRAGAAEKIDPRMQKILFKKIRSFSKNFPAAGIREEKAALRTMTPDGRFVIGEDPRLKGFFWVAGLGGHGVTTSFSVGDLASDLILGKKREKSLIDALSPERFLKS